MAVYRAEGIIIRGRPLGEADRIITAFTREEGVIEAVARGARRPRSRLVGATLPFTHLQMMLFRGKGLDTLSQTEMINPFDHLRSDLVHTAYATYWCELLSELLPPREADEQVFILSLAAFLLLGPSMDPGLLSTYFELKLVSELGYRPALDHCSLCGGDMAEQSGALLPSSGTVLCARCVMTDASGKSLSAPAMAHMRALQNWDIRRLGVLRSPAAVSAEVRQAVRQYAACQIGRPLKSRHFLETVEAQA